MEVPEEEVLPPSVPQPPGNIGRALTARSTLGSSSHSVAAPNALASASGMNAMERSGRPQRPTALQIAGALANWGTCIFIIVLVVSQFCGVFWNTVESRVSVSYGQAPSLGPYQVLGTNDAAFTDRSIACVLEGRFYKPQLMSELLADTGATPVIDSTGAAVNGYRLTTRNSGATLSPSATAVYSDACALLATTLTAVLDTCDALGYNVTRDALRIVASDAPNVQRRVEDALPVVVMPYWDSAPVARFATPGWDGSACMFRLVGKYLDSSASIPGMRIASRAQREAKTIEWLRADATTSVWRNGWLHVAGQTLPYMSDLLSTDSKSTLGILEHMFNPQTRTELDCSNSDDCLDDPSRSTWGDEFAIRGQQLAYTSVTVLNDVQYGLFLYASDHLHVVSSQYGWETLISNVCLSFVLGRWLMAMAALLAGYHDGRSAWFNGGLGCVSSSRAFNVLPVALLPRLPVTLSAFWTVGCVFEGDQSSLSECWFAVYPAIIEFSLVYYSLLNIGAKLLRRRISDVLFPPTVAALCLLHRLRMPLARSGLLGVDGRVTTIVSSTEAADLRLIDFFISDIAWRLNGRVMPLVATKIVILVLNLLPLLFSKYIPPAKQPDTGLRGVEKTLAIRASNVGGLGRSPVYIMREGSAVKADKGKDTDKEKSSANDGKLALNGYELVRLGYVVLDSKYLVTFDAWDIIWFTVPLRRVYYLYNHRIVLFPVQDINGLAVISGKPQMCRLDDDRFEGIRFWKIAAQPVKC